MYRTACITLVLLFTATSCGLFGGGGSKKEQTTKPKDNLNLRTVTVTMAPNANNGWPASIELVRVTDADLVTELLAITPQDWFGAKGEAFKLAHPEAYFNQWQPVPGSSTPAENVAVRSRVAGVLYCNLPGISAPSRVRQDGHIVIRITEHGCEVDSRRKSRN